jgi:NodT family efflux transporter outer membrane factor (OMF) lipoprotein
MKLLKTIRLSCGYVSLVFFTASCTFQPSTYNKDVELPANFDIGINKVGIIKQPKKMWWGQFNNQELNLLILEMNSNNKDVATANYRIQQSRALLGVQRANNWPNVDGSVDIARQSNSRPQTPNYEEANFIATYEVDFSGYRDASNKSSEYQLQYQYESMRGTQLSLQALLAQQYFDALALKERVKLTKQNLIATQSLYQLIKTRFELGTSNQIELDQQLNILIEQKKLYKSFMRDFDIARRGISVLIGRENFDSIELTSTIGNIALPGIEVTQPASLIEFRPDIRMAELNLMISDAELYAAKAKRWPSVTLSVESTFSDLFSSGDSNTSLLGSLTAPIFQAGRISNQITAAEAGMNIELVNYRMAVVNALQETFDSLTSYHFQKSIYDLQYSAVINNESLHNQAKLLYEAGATDFLNLLSAQKSLFQARDSLVQHRAILLNSSVNIFKAMGASPATINDKKLLFSNTLRPFNQEKEIL